MKALKVGIRESREKLASSFLGQRVRNIPETQGNQADF